MHIKHAGKEKLLTGALFPLSWSRKQQWDMSQVTSVFSGCVLFMCLLCLQAVKFGMFRGEVLHLCRDLLFLICSGSRSATKMKQKVRKQTSSIFDEVSDQLIWIQGSCVFLENFLTFVELSTKNNTVSVSCLTVRSAATGGQWHINPSAAAQSSAKCSKVPCWERHFMTSYCFSPLWLIFGCALLLTIDCSAGFSARGVNVLLWREAMEAGILECQSEDDTVDTESHQGMCALRWLSPYRLLSITCTSLFCLFCVFFLCFTII